MFRPSYLPVAITTAALLASPLVCNADLVYRPNEGWTREGGFFGNSATVAKTADLQLQYAADLEKKGDLAGARDALKKLIKVFPLAQQVAEARFKLGGMLEKQGRYEEAFETFDELVLKSPESKEFTPALDAMFGIAKRYMDGEKRRLFGIKTFASNERAEQMFDTIMKRAPYSRSAAQVMLFRGMMMERQGKDAEALAAYQQIVDRFPTDPIADEAQYQMGYIRLHSVKSGSYDNTDRVRAQESFEDFLNRAPQNGRTSQARENIQLVEAKNRQAALDVAKFYDKTGKTKAAVLSFKDVIRDYPNSQEADYAKRRIDAIRMEKGPEVLETRKESAEATKSTGAPKQPQAKVNTSSRSDYVGPKLKTQQTEETAPKTPSLRLQDSDASPTGAPSVNSGANSDLRLPSPRVTPPAPQNP